MNKNPEQTRHTRQALKAAFIGLIEAGQRPTVDAVCKKAGYNRCTFYRYYPDADAILTEIGEELRARLRHIALQATEQNSQEQFMRGLARLYQERGNAIHALLCVDGARFINETKEQMAPLIFRFYHLDRHPQRDLIAAILANTISQTFLLWNRADDAIDAGDLVALMGRLIHSGISGLQCDPA